MSSRDDAIYVGYLPLPPRHARFLRLAIPVSLWLIVAAAGLAAWGMRSAGTGTWTFLATEAEPETWTGQLQAEPYPLLLVPQDDGSVRTVLIVEAGKFGAQDRLAAYDGADMTLTGWRLEREGRSMIELLPGDEAIARTSEAANPAAAATTAAPATAPARPAIAPRPVTLSGELMDGKCHLGAMKPGDGKTHKACAILCINAGIPPLLKVTDDAGESHFVLVISADGTQCDPAIVARAGEPLVLSGTMFTVGDLPVLMASAE
ncbi:MAG: hypothetical protein AB8G96_01930 [Phycisphaerales bacterium]